jgi:hypothetical protein
MPVLHLRLLARHAPSVFRLVRHQVSDRQGLGLQVPTAVVNYLNPVAGGRDDCIVTPRVLDSRACAGMMICTVRIG